MISALQAELYDIGEQVQTKRMLLAHNVEWLKLCCSAALVSFDQQSATVRERDGGEKVTEIPAVVYRQCDTGPSSRYFSLVIRSKEAEILSTELERSPPISQALLLEGISYTKGITLGLGETSIHVASQRGRTPLNKLEPLSGVTLGSRELFDAESGLLAIGRFEPGAMEPVSCFDIYWYTSSD